MGAYLGHFVDLPNDQFLALGADFQTALDGIDKIGQADESSVRPVEHRLLMRLRITCAKNPKMVFFEVPDDPFDDVNQDLIHLRDNPGTGATGDTMRSYGPECDECGALHFPDQECRVFQEFSDRLQVSLFASKLSPGDAVLEVFENGAVTPNRYPGMVKVANLANGFGPIPFRLEDGRYRTDAHVDVDVDGEEILRVCARKGITVPVHPDLEEEDELPAA